ncbi:MAG: hypothetical protein LH702_24250 [Phormidesmis sp. CAN_BIN44]|nr:hypothetical protein [Phormidesmis sp. CAN_BIN44]
MTQKDAAISAIAQNLNLYTLQGVAVSPTGFVVPTLDGTLLHVSLQGAIVTLVDLQKANRGIPFGIATHKTDWIVTTSDYFPNHYLVRVKPDGTVTTIADLSDLSGDAGAPFGVAVSGDDYVVTLSTDVVEATGLLLRVSAAGVITKIADLTDGNPFGVAIMGDDFVVAQSKGQLLRVTPAGKTSVLIDLQKAGFGIPFGVAVRSEELFVTTNLGFVIKVDRSRKGVAIANLLNSRFGVPSGIAVTVNGLIVTTGSGYLLRITE